MIPGQRDGSQQWFLHFIRLLSEHFTVAQCDVFPAVIKTPQGPGMVHADDSLVLLPLQWALKEFLPVVKSKFEVTFDVASKPGDEFSFLKRQHVIMEDMIVIRPPPQYIEHMAEVCGVKPNPRQCAPCIQQLRDKDESGLLSTADASKFRAGVGIALYISCDRPDIGYTVHNPVPRLLHGFSYGAGHEWPPQVDTVLVEHRWLCHCNQGKPSWHHETQWFSRAR